MLLIENNRPVWWEPLVCGPVAFAYDTGRKRFFGLFSLIFYFDLDGKWNSRWTHSSSLIPRFVSPSPSV